jgi:hypothetical protein
MVDIKYYGSKAEVFHGTAKFTKGGLTKKEIKLITDKWGNERYKSKKQQAAGHKKGTFRDKWAKAMKAARKELVKEGTIDDDAGFIPVGGKSKDGKALLKRTREHMLDQISKMKIK